MCDVLKGLLRLNTSSGAVEQLASRVSSSASGAPGAPIFYANSLDIAPNGSIYFSSSTDILPARARSGCYDTGFAWALNNMRGLPAGRVLAYHPATRQTHVVASGFYYADGVALSEDGSFLLVVETDALRVVKVWLAGDKAGQREVLVAALPGLPAGLSKASDGNFWVSMTVPVPPYSRYLGSVLLRALIAWSPRTWRPPVKVWGAVLKVSPEGRILQLLLDPTGARVATASAATEHNGRLFLGSIMGVHLFQCMLPVRSTDSAVFRACIVAWLSVASVVAHSAHTLPLPAYSLEVLLQSLCDTALRSCAPGAPANITLADVDDDTVQPPTNSPGPFISYVDLQVVEQHVAGSGSQHAAAGNATDWHAVGGWSLHEQRELWDQNAAGRVKQR
ncbi:hypothetical protein COO60DRAFT_1624013 [Scenedesmus sp. NREL 46B-D3]|nr:hypothetical protein COO60DRAFT_1624013 [Scenedesmus sp. NREL 46B-D3]